jgi:hypothetical protein
LVKVCKGRPTTLNWFVDYGYGFICSSWKARIIKKFKLNTAKLGCLEK